MPLPRLCRALVCSLTVLVASCGGGGGDGVGSSCGGGAATASAADRQAWLRCFFGETYLWYALSPSPSPAGFGTVDSYFDALLYQGGDAIPNGGGAVWPADRWSFFQTTEAFNRFFGDGQSLGYGIAVNGLEAVADGDTRLFVRYVEPLSPAARSTALPNGLQRGDEILTINTTPVATLVAANDFSALTADTQGRQLALSVRRASGQAVAMTLDAALFALTPVQGAQVVQSPNGRKLGYVFVKDMISQIGSPLTTAMTSFKNQGVQDLVVDLRYNGGGLVSVGATVASFVSGSTKSGQVYTRLLYNDKLSSNNRDYAFGNPGGWSGFSRVYVLAGERTCSAAEQVINGLRGVDVQVFLLGTTTCGKPVGFLPTDDAQGTTYSIVNFEGVNAKNQGRYFDGLPPTCPVAEDLSLPIGDLSDPLLVAAAYHVDNGACPVTAGSRELPQARDSSTRKRYNGGDGGERGGMIAR